MPDEGPTAACNCILKIDKGSLTLATAGQRPACQYQQKGECTQASVPGETVRFAPISAVKYARFAVKCCKISRQVRQDSPSSVTGFCTAFCYAGWVMILHVVLIECTSCMFILSTP